MLSKRPKRPMPKEREVPKNDLAGLTLDTPELVLAFCESRQLIDHSSLKIEELIAQTPGLSLRQADLGKFDAYIKKTGEKAYEIVVNKTHHKNRQRFSMAHEYAHFQLHREKIEEMPEGEQILHRGSVRNPIETQANRFAADILLPKSEFLTVLQRTAGNVPKMAEAFGVSQLALRYRAKSLGIGGHGV